MTRAKIIEAATRYSYEQTAKRRGVNAIGWNRESNRFKAAWRKDVREVIEYFEEHYRPKAGA
jgi:phosphoenolpyruvate carboxylase